MDAAGASAAIVALLIDLINREHIALSNARGPGDADWRLVRSRGRKGQGRPLAGGERRLLRRLFPLRKRELPLSRLKRKAGTLYWTHDKLQRAAGRLRDVPTVQDALDDFREYLTSVKPAELDPQARRDYLPYVISLAAPDSWLKWGVLPTGKRGALGLQAFSKAHQAAGTSDDAEPGLPLAAGVLYAQISPIMRGYIDRRFMSEAERWEAERRLREGIDARRPL